ncbi:MAG: hypothetical protein OZ948_10195 [Deltaproteobacteria bacterium]|nr:hypothetical protein [Deltaproteobacteria bacterium]
MKSRHRTTVNRTRHLAAALAFASALLPALAARAALEWVSCDPIDVATFENRIHVRCSASVGGGIFYFARPVTDGAETQRYLSTLLAAQVAGRTLSILTDLADTSGAAFGCGASDCRRFEAVSFGN